MTLFSMFLLREHSRGCKPGQDLFPAPAILLSWPACGSLLESRLRSRGWQGAGETRFGETAGCPALWTPWTAQVQPRFQRLLQTCPATEAADMNSCPAPAQGAQRSLAMRATGLQSPGSAFPLGMASGRAEPTPCSPWADSSPHIRANGSRLARHLFLWSCFFLLKDVCVL